jgi:hypothetical protein
LLLDWVRETPPHPLVDLGSASEYDPRRTVAEATSPLRFLSPLTLQATGSDPHQVCLAWLCCTYRLSQPHGALFLPKPFRLCFTPVTPVGFDLQRFSLPRCRPFLPESLPLLTLPGGRE